VKKIKNELSQNQEKIFLGLVIISERVTCNDGVPLTALNSPNQNIPKKSSWKSDRCKCLSGPKQKEVGLAYFLIGWYLQASSAGSPNELARPANPTD